jgi:fluoride exporter
MEYVWVACGSAVGGMARHWVSVLMLKRYGASFPWGTLTVNIVGSFVIGFVAVLAAGGKNPFATEAAQRFLLVGLLGGFTTFSSFSLQTLQLIEKGSLGLGVSNVLISVVSCLAAVWLGLRLGRLVLG